MNKKRVYDNKKLVKINHLQKYDKQFECFQFILFQKKSDG